MLISLVIFAGFIVGFLVAPGLKLGETTGLFVPWPAGILAAITALTSLVAYFWAPERFAFWAALATYLLLTLTAGVLIALTGATSSPFIALWLVITVFSGLFGNLAIIGLFLTTLVYFLYLFFLHPMLLGRDQIIVFVLGGELPLAISYIIWHSQSLNQSQQVKAYDALAQQLNQVANKSEIVINAIADGVVAIDGQRTVQLINPAAQQLLGWRKEDAIGLDYTAVIKLGDSKGNLLPAETDPLQRILLLHDNRSMINNDLMLTTNSGKKIFVSLMASPVNPAQPGTGAIAVFRDITAEKTEERQKAEFISTASHEMRTPVAAIEGYLGLALNPATAAIDDKARMYLQKAHESAQHLGHLFQDLLDVSKAEDGRIKNSPTAVDVVLLLGDVVNGARPKAEGKHLTLICKSCDSRQAVEHVATRNISPAFYVYADPDHLREIFDNLAENAIKYTKEGEVSVDVTATDTEVSINFSDTGLGIPPEDLPHLFQKFYRVDNSDTREIGGTGLGLYLCRRLAEINNGHIAVRSELGRGSTFSVVLPRITHERATEILEQVQAAHAAQSNQTQPAPEVTSAPVTDVPQPESVAMAVAPTEVPAPAAPVAAPIAAAQPVAASVAPIQEVAAAPIPGIQAAPPPPVIQPAQPTNAG